MKTRSITLPDEVRHHLGKLLVDAYRGSNQLASLDHFAELLAQLDSAVGKSQRDDERQFHAGLIEAMPALRSFAISLSKNPVTADDLVQETMLRAWRSRAAFTAGTNLNAWLFTILRNNFYSSYRKMVREVSDGDGEYAARLSTLPEQHGHLDMHDVAAAFEKLSPPMREALILIAVEDFSYEDAARIMKCEIGTVKSRVWRARQQLAAHLGYGGAEVGADQTTLSVLSLPGASAEG